MYTGGGRRGTSYWDFIWLIWFIAFNATFSNISAISSRPFLVVEEAGVPEGCYAVKIWPGDIDLWPNTLKIHRFLDSPKD